jgi:ABC-type sugar transport system permease subunit
MKDLGESPFVHQMGDGPPVMNDPGLTVMTWLSIGLNLLFPLLLAILSNTDDSPYSVLMIVPILQAAFRFPVATVASVVAVASCFNFLWVWFGIVRDIAALSGRNTENDVLLDFLAKFQPAKRSTKKR